MMAPSALPSSWKRPPGRRSPLSGRNRQRTRPGSVQASQTSGTGAGNWRRSSTTCAGASCRCPWATVRLQWSSSVMRSRMSVPPGSLIRAAVAASCQLGLQRVEALAPLPAQVGEPAFDADKRGAVEGVEAAGAFGADVGESALPQNAQLTRESHRPIPSRASAGRRRAADRSMAGVLVTGCLCVARCRSGYPADRRNGRIRSSRCR